MKYLGTIVDIIVWLLMCYLAYNKQYNAAMIILIIWSGPKLIGK